MFNIIKARWFQGKVTSAYPAKDPVLSDRYRGLPVLDTSKCPPDCRICQNICPNQAISFLTHVPTATEPPSSALSKGKKKKKSKEKRAAEVHPKVEIPGVLKPHIDLGKCLFCNECQNACPCGCIHYTQNFRVAARKPQDLVVTDGTSFSLAESLEKGRKKLFHRSLKLRVVSAGDCNACNVEVNVLNTLFFDLPRFGIQIVASPRHADGVLITGPVSENMREALLKTYDAVPGPKVVIAVGSCAITGGPFRDHPEIHNGAMDMLPIDLYVPGCPPHPMSILDGMLRLLGRL